MAKHKSSKTALVAKANETEKCTEKQKRMKRKNNLFEKVVDIDNIREADRKARRNKSRNYGIELFDKNRDENLLKLQRDLEGQTYKTGEYDVFMIHKPKDREIARLEYKHRIVHHAIMNIMEPIWVASFTADTYSCIKGRGIHKCLDKVRIALKDVDNTKYCLKIDIQKYYPSIDRGILLNLIGRKIKDEKMMMLHAEIINSAPGMLGVPIGNYLSQFYANLYLSYFDHWIKENKGVKYYFRYCDDMVFFSSDKKELHQLLSDIRYYLNSELNLYVKKNYQIFPVESRGVDFVGYKMYHTHTLMRKSIKKAMIRKRNKPRSMASYGGWAIHCNTINLFRKIFNTERNDKFKRKTRKN